MYALVQKGRNVYFLAIVCIIVCTSFVSCQQIQDKNIRKIETMLSQADMFINMREFDKSQEKAHTAITKLNGMINEDRGNVHLRLLRARATITLFIAKNTLIIENAPHRKSSLVRIPEKSDYIDYDKTVTIVQNDIQKVLQTTQKLSKDQQASAYAILATLFRLDQDSAGVAFKEYEKAIKIYESLILSIKNKKKHFSPQTITTDQLEDQISSLRLAQAEVALLLEQWNKALITLEKMLGGKDLKYFDVQFQILEHSLARLEAKIKEGNTNIDPRTLRLERLSQTWRDIRKPRDKLLSDLKTHELELLHTDIKLIMAQNNLSYRIICYHNLRQYEQFETAREILHNYYPDLHNKLLTYLEYKPGS